MPLSAPLPYVPTPYDSSRSDARMADLMQYRGQLDTRAIQQAGDRRARMIQGIGGTASNALGDLIQYRQEAPQRALQKRRIQEEMQKYDRADRFKALDKTLGGADDETRAKAYEQAGFREEAEGARDRSMRRDATKLEINSKELDIQGKSIKQAGEILDAIKTQKDPGSRAAAYNAAVPQLRKLVPYMAAQIPDQYSDEFLDVGSQWGKTQAEKLAEQRESNLELDARLKAVKSKAEAIKLWQSYLGKTLSKSQDANEWDEQRMVAARNGAPQDVISLFGDTFSPESAAHAREIAEAATDKTDKDPTVGSVEWYFGLSPAERKKADAIRQQYARSDDAPKDPKDEGTALRWYYDKRDEAKQNYPDPESTEQLTAFAEIEKAFRQMTGRPAPHIPELNVMPGGPSAAPPRTPPSNTPKNSPKNTISTGVASALTGKKPAVYTLKNGSKWRVMQDGSIVPVK